ncbi:MAG: o-succinylbenzoate--CoA ligase [Chloroflexota bacterium]|nr:o-succinylbenzoate--CoA ligase [Chloroflexota bacterium]
MAGLELVPDWLRQRAELTPERLALAVDDRSWSFAELDRRVDAAAQALDDRGVQPGQRVGLLAPNGAGFVVAVHALMRLGAVLVPINARLTQPEVEWQTHDAELSLVLDESALRELMECRPGPKRIREFGMHEPHSIVYTSGTTGRPKGAILTYANHWSSATASVLNLGLAPEDRWLACLPLFHVGGLSILLRSVVYGIAAVVHPRFDPRQVNDAIDDRGVSIVSLVGVMLDRVLDERLDRPFPPTLRVVLLGGGPAPLPLLERALRAGAPVVQTYGLTETASQVVTLAPEDAVRKVGSAGKPLMGSQIRIAADGEIWVRGPTVSPGYLHQPENLAGEWLRTGDLGYLDADGYLYVLDRRDDLIISGGENIYPSEVEAALLAHPAVEEAGVVGVADRQWGRMVVGVVKLVPRQTATADELIAFCRERLAGYKVPRRIEFRDSLPRNAAGKLLRRNLEIQNPNSELSSFETSLQAPFRASTTSRAGLMIRWNFRTLSANAAWCVASSAARCRLKWSSAS